MDDYLGGADSIENAIKLIKEIIHIHEQGGFIICNWICNSKEVLKEIDYKLTSLGEKNLDIDVEDTQSEKILGLWWNPSEDVFCFDIKLHKIDKNILDSKKRPTKRDF